MADQLRTHMVLFNELVLYNEYFECQEQVFKIISMFPQKQL